MWCFNPISLAPLARCDLAFGANQKGKPWEKKRTGRIIDYIYLPRVEPRCEPAEWEV